MAVVINGTTGVSGVDGSAGTPSYQGTDSNTGIFFPAADTIAFGEGGAEAMRIDSSGNVGIGTTSPSGKLNISDGTSCQVNINSAAAGATRQILFSTSTNTQEALISANNSTGELKFESGRSGTSAYFQTFYTNNAERMRIDPNGNLLIGTTSSPASSIKIYTSDGTINSYYAYKTGGVEYIGTYSNHPFAFATNNVERARITSGGYFKASNDGTYLSSTGNYHEFKRTTSGVVSVTSNTNASPYGADITFSDATPNNTTNYFLLCNDNTNEKLYIYSSGTISNRTGTYNSISDLKLKQDVVDASSQWDDIKALRIVKYRLKDEVAADPNYPAYIGVIAQEVEQVSPGLIDNCPDFENVEVTDEEGNVTTKRQPTGTVTKSVKSSIIYMKAVKALQEAMTRIEALEAEVAALKGAN